MKLLKPLKVLLLIITVWSPIYSVLAVTFVMDMMIREGLDVIPPEVLALHIITVGAAIALIFSYGVHLSKNERLSGNVKMLWLVGIIFGSFVAMPLYWWKHIWQHDR